MTKSENQPAADDFLNNEPEAQSGFVDEQNQQNNPQDFSGNNEDENSPSVKTQEPAAQKLLSQSQIKKLHRDCAKYRYDLKTFKEENILLKQQNGEMLSELNALKQEKFERDILHKLEKLGCLKPSLVLKDLPDNLENIDDFLQNYKNENAFLFKPKKNKHGYSYRSVKTINYTTSQQMNNCIRSALNR